MALFKLILNVGVVIFAPDTALQAVTGIPIVASLIGTGVVATIFTCLGMNFNIDNIQFRHLNFNIFRGY